MSSQYPNSGAIFVNARKTEANHPDRQGNADITCPHCQRESPYWISGWLKTGAKGQLLSVAFKPKEAPNAASGHTRPTTKPEPTTRHDDDVPF